jgi:shikimate dehydrogenase
MDYSLIENQVDIGYLDRYAAIIGECPSKGARSPQLWNVVFKSEGQNCEMLPLDVTKSNIVKLLNDLNRDKKFIGGAIAVPYKEVIAKWLGDNITPEAKKIGAVNCLYRNSDGLLYGTNTDGEASIKTFIDKFGSIENKSVLILGAGGAGKAVASYFSSASKNTIILSRSESDKRYADKIDATWKNWNMVDEYIANIDIIVNCTSVGFGNQELESPIDKQQIARIKDSTIVFDIIYQPLKTKLLEMAEKIGIHTFNGLEMNLEQAVLAYQYAVKSGKNLDEIRKIMLCVS